MNGKAARALRKLSKIDKKADRDYQDVIFTTERDILQYDPKNDTVKAVKRKVDSITIECVDASRKVYKYMKKKFINNSYEGELTVLPSKEDLKAIEDEFLKESKSQDLENESGQEKSVALSENGD